MIELLSFPQGVPQILDGHSECLGCFAVTEDDLKRLLKDDKPFDLWAVANFFRPLKTLQETIGSRYQISEPPRHLWEARDFAVSLWECDDDDAMRRLAAAHPEGAAQLAYLLSLYALERQLQESARTTGIEPVNRKPFAALASRALEWLDEVEATTPGKTERPNQ